MSRAPPRTVLILLFSKEFLCFMGSAPFVFYGKKSRKRMLRGRKRPRERTPVVWRQDAFPFFYSIWESARGSVFLARRADKTHATAGNSFLCFQYIICGRICQGEIENSGSVQNREVGQRTEGKKSRKKIAALSHTLRGRGEKRKGRRTNRPEGAFPPSSGGRNAKQRRKWGELWEGGLTFLQKYGILI